MFEAYSFIIIFSFVDDSGNSQIDFSSLKKKIELMLKGIPSFYIILLVLIFAGIGVSGYILVKQTPTTTSTTTVSTATSLTTTSPKVTTSPTTTTTKPTTTTAPISVCGNEECELGENAQNCPEDCGFSMLFVVLTKPNASEVNPEKMQILEELKSEFSNEFFKSTLNRVIMNTNFDTTVHLIPENTDLNQVFFRNLLKNEFLNEQGDFDYNFFTFYTNWDLGSDTASWHDRIVYDHWDLGKTNLLGINMMMDINRLSYENFYSSNLRMLFHETGHQWAAYIGRDKGFLNIPGSAVHYFNRLSNGVDCIEGNCAMMGGLWIKNEDGTYSTFGGLASDRPPEEYTGDRYYCDLTLFQMGILSREEVKPVLYVEHDDIVNPNTHRGYKNIKVNATWYTIDEIVPLVSEIPSDATLISAPNPRSNGTHATYTDGIFHNPWGDFDNDYLPNWIEIHGELGYVTDYLTADTDQDGIDDYQELKHRSNPTDSSSLPEIVDSPLEITYPEQNEELVDNIVITAQQIPFLIPDIMIKNIKKVIFQYKGIGEDNWVNIRSDSTYPYSINWGISNLYEGYYDLRILTEHETVDGNTVYGVSKEVNVYLKTGDISSLNLNKVF